jgi:putative transposase
VHAINPQAVMVIKSTVPVRHRTSHTRNCVSRTTFLGAALRLIEEAEKSWQKIRGSEKIELFKGIPFKNGELVQDNSPIQQKLAA